GQGDQSGGGTGEGLLDQLRLAFEVLVVLGVQDQGGGHDLVGDAVEGVVPDLADQVGERVGAGDPHPVAQPPPDLRAQRREHRQDGDRDVVATLVDPRPDEGRQAAGEGGVEVVDAVGEDERSDAAAMTTYASTRVESNPLL